MSVYPESITNILASLENAGEPANASASGRGVNFSCGGAVKISLTISEDAGTVEKARFRTNGCGFMVAAAEVACSRLSGTALSDLHGLEELSEALLSIVGTEPSNRQECLSAALDAVRAAFRDHRERLIEEFTGEKALICTCFGVSEETIVRSIESIRATTVEQVSAFCRAGSGCGACRMLIQELIDAADLLE
jgi:NifU-like protein